VTGALLVGFAGGVLAGLLGVGGGIIYVPGLALFLGLSQVDAEATSLVAIVPVAVVGTWRQSAYGNVNMRDALTIGALSVAGAIAGATMADALSERALRIVFAALLIGVAAQFVRRAIGDGAGDRTRDGSGEPARDETGNGTGDARPPAIRPRGRPEGE
jgi:uncharacterized membrane protein YfcA